jgi:hypothetical protein
MRRAVSLWMQARAGERLQRRRWRLGGHLPAGTISSTSATVTLPAVATMGLKLRDVRLNTRLPEAASCGTTAGGGWAPTTRDAPAVSPFHALTNAKSPRMASSMMNLAGKRHGQGTGRCARITITNTSKISGVAVNISSQRSHSARALAAIELSRFARLRRDSHAAVRIVLDGKAAVLDDGAGACSEPNRTVTKPKHGSQRTAAVQVGTGGGGGGRVPVGGKNAGMPAPPARSRSASVPWGVSSTSSSPRRYL